MAIEQNFLFTGSDDSTIKVWDLIGYSLIFTFTQHEEPIRDLIFIEESGHLISCSDDGKIHIWDYPHRKLLEV
jgi:WD40 repeat protein